MIRSHHMRLAIRFALLALILRAAVAQTQPDVAEILKKVSDTYRTVSQYEFVAEATGRETGNAPGHVLIAFKSPNKYRMESSFPGLTGGDSAFNDVVTVCDGSTVWFHLRKSNQYASIPLSEATPGAPGDLGDLRPEAVDEFAMMRYRRATDFIEGAKFLREETIELGGTKVDCYVVTVSRDGSKFPYTWWVDKQRYRILREDDSVSSSVFTTIKLNEPLPDDLFTFKPPPGARKMEMHP